MKALFYKIQTHRKMLNFSMDFLKRNRSRLTKNAAIFRKLKIGLLTTTHTELTLALRTPHYYGHPTITDTPLLRIPHYYGHPTITDTPLLRTPHYYGHPTITDTPLLRTPHYYGHPAITDTPLLRTPRY